MRAVAFNNSDCFYNPFRRHHLWMVTKPTYCPRR